MKKIITSIISLFLISVVISGCSSKEKDQKIIRIGNVNGNFSAVVAKEKKFFEEEFDKDGIKVEFSTFESGPAVIDSFTTNRIDVAQLGDQPIIAAISNGVDIKVIGSSISSSKGLALVAGNNSNIKDLSDLKGKKIGVAIGTIYHHLLSGYLKKANISQEEVEIVNLSFSDSVTALAQGNVDSIAIGEPQLSIIKEKKVGKIIADGEGVLRPTTPIVVSGDLYKNNPDIVNRVLQVYKKTNKWILDNKVEAAEIGSKEVPISKESMLNLIELGSSGIDINDDVKKEIKSTYNFLRDNKLITNEIKDIDEIYIKPKE